MMRASLTLLAAGLLAGSPVFAQQADDYSKVEIRTTRLAENVHLLEGVGGPVIGAVLMQSGPDGVLLVDSQFPQTRDKLLAAMRKISDRPVRYLVNTHSHGDHTAGNEGFAREGAVIFARDQLRERMARPAPGRVTSPLALPVVTYDDVVSLHINGERVQLIPIRAAHTDGDTLVYFPKSDVLATGDYFRTAGFPRGSRAGGGSLSGILAGLGVTIGYAGPNTRVVPGHGPVTDRNGLIAHRDQLLAVRDRIAPLVAAGKTVEEVLATNPAADFKAEGLDPADTAERFVRWVYEELQAGG